MDTKSLIAYSKVYEHILGELPNSNDYDDRIIAQKIGYLVQDMGVYLGEMNFFWHKRGPYSRTLASALRYFEVNKESFIIDCSRVKIYDVIIPKLDHLKKLINLRPTNCSVLIWLEICASLKFLSKEFTTTEIDFLSVILLKRKPFLLPYKDDIYKSWKIMNNSILN
ncbi:hypothetical protein [Paenibacillus sp. SN-8-1]|uniref:hypothetical protein n=1 Tax=Paenibacillus sp. SN-8-1 TaxID=3435409 RepID=UPI003D9A32CD